MRNRNGGPGAAHMNFRMFGARGPLLNPNNGKGGGGTGGTGGTPGGDNSGGDEGDSDLETKILPIFNKLFHKASSEREKRFEAKIMKGLETTLGSKLDELKAAILEEQPNQQPQQNQNGQQKTDQIPPEIAAALSKAQKDAKEAKDLAEKWKREADQEKERGRKAEERQLISTSLNGKVKPQLLDMVVDQLHTKNVTRDPETGKILWKGDDGDLLPFKDGIDAWAKSDFGKEVAPPREARGSGGRGASGDDLSTGKGPMTADQLGALISGQLSGVR